MRDLEIEDTAPGKLIPYGKESYYRPEPLPPARHLELDDEFYDSVAEATFWLGKLSGISLEIDFPPVLYTSLLRKEAMESAEIEGADIDYNALYSLETRSLDADSEDFAIEPATSEAERKDTQEVLNYEQAIEEGIETLDSGGEISVELLHDLHRTLLTGVPEDRTDTDTVLTWLFSESTNENGGLLTYPLAETTPTPPYTASSEKIGRHSPIKLL